MRHQLYFLLAVVCFTAVLTQPASAQLRLVSYNTLDKPTNIFDNAEFQTIFGAVAGESVNGIARPVDILTLQEQAINTSVNTVQQAADQLNALHNTNAYTAVFIGSGSDRLGMVYNSDTVDLLDSDLVAVGIRPGLRGQFRPVGYTDAGSDFYVYSTHFKAGSSSSDFALRATEATNLRNNADALGPGANVIYTGDLNLKSSSDLGYTNFFVAGDGKAVDPTGVSAWGIFTPEILTQSTRTSGLSDGGAGGGMDDRFDFQLVTEEVADGSGFAIITPGSTGAAETSYRAFGNDGNTFNQAINDNTAGRSQPVNVLNALHDFSDHLPVVADYQLPALLDLTVTTTADQVFAGTGVGVLAEIGNAAPVALSNAADELAYSVTTSGDVIAETVFSDQLAVADASNLHAWVVDTATSGLKDNTLTYTSLSDGVESQTIDVSVEVFDHATASFSGDTATKSLEIDFGTVELGFSDDRAEDVFSLFNLESTTDFTSALSVADWTVVSGDTDTLGFLAGFPVTGDLAAGESRLQVVTLDTTSAGVFSATYELEVGDALDAAGALSETLTLTLLAEVVADVLLGDYNGNGTVDAADYTVWADSFGSTTNLLADGNGNGTIDAADYTIWADNFGTGTAQSLGLVIPEPGTLGLLSVGVWGLVTRRRKAVA